MEPARTRDNHGELLNPNPSKSWHCSTASHVETEPAQAWDSYGELAGEAAMPCTSLEFDCSSTSPSRSAQAFPFFPAQGAETDPAQTSSSHGELEEVDTSLCIFSKGDCRLTEPSRSSDAEVDSSKIANEDEIFLESGGSSVGDEEGSLSRCEDGEDTIDRAMKIESWGKQEDAEALESMENHMGVVDNSGIPEDYSRCREEKALFLRLSNEESTAKDSKETYGDSSVVEGNSVSKESSSRSASTHSSRFVDADGKGCKRLRITNGDEISCAAIGESLAVFANGFAGKVACTSHNDNAQHPQPYLPGLDNESALRCLAFVPLSDLCRLAMVGKQYRDLVKSRDIFKLRRMYGMVEHLVFIFTSATDVWTAYDANRNVWTTLPPANVNDPFDLSDRESLSAGTHVLWLGKEMFEFVYYRYDLISNNWERGPTMVNPRCLFASASCGEFAFVAGGFGPADNNGALSLLNSAERYSSLTGRWEPLPPMSTPRHKCSGFFMDGKFYVIGGRDVNHQHIMSGEEYNPITGVWRTIPNMYFTPEVARRDMFEPSPPLVAVVNNQLYAVENTTNILKMYNKHNNTWRNLGLLPVPADLRNGWGVAFKALGDRLFVMGDVDGIAAFCWQPGPNATEPVWQCLCRSERGTSFLYNCAVMAC